MTPRIGWYGDDFTGATDTLATMTERGLRAVLFLGIPTPKQFRAAGPLDAVGIAGAARSMTPEAMRDELEPVGRFFADLNVSVMHYKVCSTFDSAPSIGSIGTAAAILRTHFPNAPTPIVGGQPNLGRYCLFGHLFAASGSGEVVRIDRHPTMKDHPVTPMHEADLRRHLATQGLNDIANIDYRTYEREDAAAILDEKLDCNAGIILFDVSRQADLRVIGEAIWHQTEKRPLLAIGASSVGNALADAWPFAPIDRLSALPAPITPSAGPVLALAGSLSPITRAQIIQAKSYRHLTADVQRLVDDHVYAQNVAQKTIGLLRSGQHVLIATDLPNGRPYPPSATARATASLIGTVVAQFQPHRIAIAGGDTSSYAAQAVDLWGLSYMTTISPGVTLCRGHSEDPALDGIEVVLKGGQMGLPDLFETLAHGMQHGQP